MPKLQCHICQSLKGLIVLRLGLSICPRCLYNLPLNNFGLPPVIRKQFVFHSVVDPNGTLDFIGAQLMANFLSNGMTVSAVARQMGIARATVYKRLHRHNLVKPNDEDKIRLQPTIDDVGLAGGTMKRMRVKSVTPALPGRSGSRRHVGSAGGSDSNAEKR